MNYWSILKIHTLETIWRKNNQPCFTLSLTVLCCIVFVEAARVKFTINNQIGIDHWTKNCVTIRQHNTKRNNVWIIYFTVKMPVGRWECEGKFRAWQEQKHNQRMLLVHLLAYTVKWNWLVTTTLNKLAPVQLWAAGYKSKVGQNLPTNFGYRQSCALWTW